MSTISKLAGSKLASSKEYRDEFVSAFLKQYIPFQIRTIRKKRKISQQQLAKDSDVTQGVISRAEDANYGNLTFNTALRIAAGYDLAFVGKFVRFSEFLKVVDELSEDSLDLPGFVDELEQERVSEELAERTAKHATASNPVGVIETEFVPAANGLMTIRRASPDQNIDIAATEGHNQKPEPLSSQDQNPEQISPNIVPPHKGAGQATSHNQLLRAGA